MRHTRLKEIRKRMKVRKCLKCEKSFKSTWIGHRKCDKCRDLPGLGRMENRTKVIEEKKKNAIY